MEADKNLLTAVQQLREMARKLDKLAKAGHTRESPEVKRLLAILEVIRMRLV